MKKKQIQALKFLHVTNSFSLFQTPVLLPQQKMNEDVIKLNLNTVQIKPFLHG